MKKVRTFDETRRNGGNGYYGMKIFKPSPSAPIRFLMVRTGITSAQEWQVAPVVQAPVNKNTVPSKQIESGPSNQGYGTPLASGAGRQPGKMSGEEEKQVCKTCCHGLLLDWSKYPSTIHPMPRPGIFAIPVKTEPAYFTLYDRFRGNCRQSARKSGCAPCAINAWPMCDADWRFAESMVCCERNLVERLKRIHLNDCWLLSTGGQYWLKYSHEQNSRLTESVNEYRQYRFRMYADLWYRDQLRIYGEFVWADLQGNELTPAKKLAR